MNTEEVKVKVKLNSFEDMYKLAEKQFIEYEKIEGVDWKNYDFSIDTPEDQLKFKDMLQIRCIEELTEAYEAFRNPQHFREELADSLNFFLSAFIMLGVDFKTMPEIDLFTDKPKIEPDEVAFITNCWDVTYKVGNLCNLLKNRPWSQSNYLVSMLDFNKRLKILWISFWNLIKWSMVTYDEVLEMFAKKYTVNNFRRDTGY